MNFSLYIAKHIYRNHDKNRKVSRPAIVIAIVGIAVGLTVMMVSIAVVLGFKHTIQNKIVGFGSHIQVSNFMSQISSKDLPVVMGDSMMNIIKKIPNIKHIERFAYKQGILKTEKEFLGVIFKGIGPEYATSFIKKHLVEGSVPIFSDKVSGKNIVISKNMADKLKVKSGQRILAYFIDDNGVRLRKYTIYGIYQTNLNQYDEYICFTDLYSVIKLNNWSLDQASGAEITVKDIDKIDKTEQYFIKNINRTSDRNGEIYSSQTMRESNPQIFNWLDLLDLNVLIIIILMIVVASVTMGSGLLIIILECTNMIGLLKALGSSNRTIRKIFLWFASFVIGRGLIIGNAIGLTLIFLQSQFGFFKLDPSIYYIDVVPVEIHLPYFVTLNTLTFVFCIFVLIGFSYFISHISPTKSIQYE